MFLYVKKNRRFFLESFYFQKIIGIFRSRFEKLQVGLARPFYKINKNIFFLQMRTFSELFRNFK